MTYYVNVYAPTAEGVSDLGANSVSVEESDQRAAANESMGGGRRVYRLRVRLNAGEKQ